MRASGGQLVAPHEGRLSGSTQRVERPTDRQPGEQMTLSGNTTLLSWGDTGARGQTGRAGGEPDQQRTESEQRQPRQRGPTDTQTGVRYPTDMEEQQPTQDRRLRAAPSHGNLTGRADQTRSAAPAGLAGRLHQQQPQRNSAHRRPVVRQARGVTRCKIADAKMF